jgi:hypothetical protein
MPSNVVRDTLGVCLALVIYFPPLMNQTPSQRFTAVTAVRGNVKEIKMFLKLIALSLAVVLVDNLEIRRATRI